MEEQIRFQSQSSRSWGPSYYRRQRAQGSRDASEVLGGAGLLTDHLPLLHPNSREKKSRVRAELGRTSRPIIGQALMREVWDWSHLMRASHPLSPLELNSTQPNLIQPNTTQANPSQPNFIQSNSFCTCCTAWMTWRIGQGRKLFWGSWYLPQMSRTPDFRY